MTDKTSEKWKSLDPRTQPGHLARRLQQLAVALFVEEVAELGLTPVQYAALHAICKQAGIDQKTLAQTISYDAATIGGVIDRLETRGLVAREVSPNDRRVRLVSPTAEGIKVLKASLPRVQRTQDRLLEPLSISERKELMRLLNVLIEANAALGNTSTEE
jgi:DNA-binding MarR family transcriptional regulator